MEDIWKIEKIGIAKKYSSKIIIVYGGKHCYVNIKDTSRTIDTIIGGQDMRFPG
jgi:hypothetical protein